jgi:hypothetical protein
MASSDFDILSDMGFEKERIELAVMQTGGCKFHYCYNRLFESYVHLLT